MANKSYNSITSLDTNWNLDPLNNLPFSGSSVQAFIKSYLGAISKAAHFDSTNNTMYWFASEDDKTAFVADPTLTNLVLFSATMSFASELYRISLTNNTGATNINIATNQTTVDLNIDFDVQSKSMTDTAWSSTGSGAYISVLLDAGATGTYTTLQESTFYSAETTFSFNARNYLTTGSNRVKVQFVSENNDSVVASITYTIGMTEMFIETLNNQWYVPIVETGDSSSYQLGGFRIIGAVSKTLHLDIYSNDTKVLGFTQVIGTTAYDTVPFYYRQSDGFDLSSLDTGIYLVSAYLTSGTLTSAPVNYNIMYVAEGDETSAQLVAINNVADVVYNYTTTTLFDYAIYNCGSLTGSPAIVVRQITGTTPTTIVDTTIAGATTGELHSYDVAIEWLTEETLSLYVQGTITYGNEQTALVTLDNSYTFPPTFGYEFYLNAASRANSDTNKLKIVNAANNSEYTPTWVDMVWMDGVDGWTEDSSGRQCLYLPARTKMTLPYGEYRFLNGDGITIEICYKVQNTTDYDETVISIMDDPTSEGFTGVRIKPTNITAHSSYDTTSANDLMRGANVTDETVIHFMLTIYPNFSGNNGMNLVTGYVNGCKAFQFDYATGANWSQAADFIVGGDRSDVSLYFARVYRSVLSDAAVQANYINSQQSLSARTELYNLLKSCMDAAGTNVDYDEVKDSGYNFFVIEMLNGATLPSRANGWDKTNKGLSNMEMHFGDHPGWDWKMYAVETMGQGTTSMNYYRWNLRQRIDKTSGKKVDVQYLSSRTTVAGSYQYTWGSTVNTGSIVFDGSGNHPAVKRITAKINFASSMQSHKIGATRAYTALHDQMGMRNEAQTYADNNSLPRPAIAVYEYPAFGFLKSGDSYSFIGLFTIGPDKGDKPTFGYNIDDSIADELITMEGTDHSRKMVMFNYPWNSDVSYLASNECINIVKGSGNYDNGWEVGNCHGYSTDDAADQSDIETILATEFKPAYDLAYENSTLIIGIPLGTYANTAADTLSYINANIASFQSQLDGDSRMTYANYQFWIEGEYILYYYDIKDGVYKSGQNLLTQHGSPSGSTVAEQNEWFKAQRRTAFMAEAEDYWDLADTLYHYCFIVCFGSMDNFGKNSYPYKMAALANGGRWKWRQDDLDSMLGIGNAGADNMPYWMEFEDSDNGSVYFGGSTSVFWNLIHECYYDDYVSTETSATAPGIVSTGRLMMEAMSSLAGGTNVYDGVMKFMKAYFWDNAQEYFPQSAYNADAAYKYEAAWLANGQEVAPLTQSLGNHYLAEKYWTQQRMTYMMSMFKAGAFGSYADTSLGQMAFRPQSLQSLTVTPLTMLYPAFASGQGMVTTARTDAGQSHTFSGPFGIDGQTTHYINASNLLTSLGDLKDLQLGAQYINPLQVQAKKLISFKIGDEDASVLSTPAVYYTEAECNTLNAALDGAVVSGDTLTSEQAALVNAALGTSYADGDTISEADANAYNATLDGAVTTSDIKTPAVYTQNVTTNVPGLTFDNTACLEEIDARNATSLSGVVNLSACPRLKEAYFGGTSLSQVSLPNGHKIETLQLPDTVSTVLMRNLKMLDGSGLDMPDDLSGIVSLLVQGCQFDAFQMLLDVFNSDNASLQYFSIQQDGVKTVSNYVWIRLLSYLKQGLDKDGGATANGYHGILSDGTLQPNANPTIDGTLMLTSGWYATTFNSLDLTDVEAYDATYNIGTVSWFGALKLIYNPSSQYIEFVDSAVEAICATQWGDGSGFTVGQAVAVANISTVFSVNTSITSFNELQYFTGLTAIADNAFLGCTALTSISIPEGVLSIGDNAFDGCTALTSLSLPTTIAADGLGEDAFDNTSAMLEITYTSNIRLTTLGDALGDTMASVFVVDSQWPYYVEEDYNVEPYSDYGETALMWGDGTRIRFGDNHTVLLDMD